MIANCPGCGTHYKHEPPKVRVRARCGRCDASLDLGRLRPYRVGPISAPTVDQARRAASHLPIGLDHPALATTIAENLARKAAHPAAPPVPVLMPVLSAENWENEDPLPQIPEMTLMEDCGSSVASVRGVEIPREDNGAGLRDDMVAGRAPEDSAPESVRGATFALWMSAGAIAGTGALWTMGGSTISGLAAGAAVGAVAGWVWLRWTSLK